MWSIAVSVLGAVLELTGLLLGYLDLRSSLKEAKALLHTRYVRTSLAGPPERPVAIPTWRIWQRLSKLERNVDELAKYANRQAQMRVDQDSDIIKFIREKLGQVLSGRPNRRRAAAVLFILGLFLQTLGNVMSVADIPE